HTTTTPDSTTPALHTPLPIFARAPCRDRWPDPGVDARNQHAHRPRGRAVRQLAAGPRRGVPGATDPRAAHLRPLPEPEPGHQPRSEEHTLNSSHVKISYAVFC